MAHYGAISIRYEESSVTSSQPKPGLTLARIADIVARRIGERAGASGESTAADTLVLKLEPSLPAEGFRIADEADGETAIAGGSALGVLYGAGKWLRTSRFADAGWSPSVWRGASEPDCGFRCLYFATHFFNWYHVAEEAEIAAYLEELALWGYNRLLLTVPFLNLDGWDDPETEISLKQLRTIYAAAQSLGLKIGINFCSNSLFRNAPAELRATPNFDPLGKKGNNGVSLCPAKPGARTYIEANAKELFRRFSDIPLDFLALSPYDEGGCGCEVCMPWGGNGFLRLSRDIVHWARERFPDIEHMLGVWCYDNPVIGEWELLRQSLERSNDWVDYIMADSHETYPEYPLKHGVPGGVPLLNFPEISMWGLQPWGGFGANPLPERLDRLWASVRDAVHGGLPYSEGLSEDVNKVIVSQYYWNRNAKAEDTLREYIAFEFGEQAVSGTLRLFQLIERNQTLVHGGQPADLEGAGLALELAGEIAGGMPERLRGRWRWRIVYLRAVLDWERYSRLKPEDYPYNAAQKPWGALLADSELAQRALLELVRIYRAKPEDDGKFAEHGWIRPPLRPGYAAAAGIPPEEGAGHAD